MVDVKCDKVTAIFSETIKATDIKFGTMLPCGKVLENKHNMVTFTKGQMVKVKDKKSSKFQGQKSNY